MTGKKTEDTPAVKKTFLVWEGAEMPAPQTHRGNVSDAKLNSLTVTEYNTVPHCVKATDTVAAATAVIRKTRRLSKMAVCEVELIDFAPNDDDEPEAMRAELNP